MPVNKREDKPPLPPTSRRATLESTGQKMQSLRARRRTVQRKHACCMAPENPMRSVNYLNNIITSMPLSSPINITKPAPAAKKNGKSVDFDSSIKEANIIKHGDHIPKKNKGKN